MIEAPLATLTVLIELAKLCAMNQPSPAQCIQSATSATGFLSFFSIHIYSKVKWPTTTTRVFEIFVVVQNRSLWAISISSVLLCIICGRWQIWFDWVFIEHRSAKKICPTNRFFDKKITEKEISINHVSTMFYFDRMLKIMDFTVDPDGHSDI